MLRPSFRKYFQDDNFSGTEVVGDGDTEPFVDANTVWNEEVSDADGSKEKAEKSIKPHVGPKSVQGSSKDPSWDSERSVYELQLNQLQEQLVETMVENQQLGTYNYSEFWFVLTQTCRYIRIFNSFEDFCLMNN